MTSSALTIWAAASPSAWGINNLFAVEPPYTPSSFSAGTFYDLMGRMVFGSVSVKL